MAIIRTLNGDISAKQLGVTYSHDHIYCIPPYWAERQDDDLLLDDPQASERELSDFRQAGGNAIYDATAPDYGRQAAAVAAMAQRQQLHIIATAGFNKGFLWSSQRPGTAQTFAEWIERSDVDELVEHVCREVTEGIEGTAHRAGVVKCGTGYNAISPLEYKTMEVIVRAQQRTGAPMHSHTEMGTMGLEQARIFKKWICPAYVLPIWIAILTPGCTVRSPTPGRFSHLTVSAALNITLSTFAPRPSWRSASAVIKSRF